MSVERRRRAYRRGRWAEALCRLVLSLKGYRIVAADYRAKVGEIDIVARKGRTLAIVEVKARETHANAAAALLPRQRRRIARASAAFLAHHPSLAALIVRFDVMLVRPWQLPRHVKNAWHLDERGGD
ncbi:MAG TPA: YraN family protein [Alphaproteobacteria bacterium]|nr:YraN family protein [Alphaproteobacteria bacterium]